MSGDKLLLTVIQLGDNAMPSTFSLIMSCFNSEGVVKGCIAIMPFKFYGNEKYELAKEQLKSISPLFDFLIVFNCQVLTKEWRREEYNLNLITLYSFPLKGAVSLITIIHASNSLDEVRSNLEKDCQLNQLLSKGALFISRKLTTKVIPNRRITLVCFGCIDSIIAEDIYNLHLNNMYVLRLNIGSGEGESYCLDLTGNWNYFNGIDRHSQYCKGFVENNIDVIKDVIEYFLGFDTSHQSDIPYSERIKGLEMQTYQEYQKVLYSSQKQPPSFDNDKTTIIDVLLFSLLIIGILYITYVLFINAESKNTALILSIYIYYAIIVKIGVKYNSMSNAINHFKDIIYENFLRK